MERIFSVRGNHESEEIELVRAEIKKYVQKLYRERYEGKGEINRASLHEIDPQFNDAADAFEIWNYNYYFRGNRFDTFHVSLDIAEPIIDRLSAQTEWDFYDIRILARTIGYAETYKQACELAKRLLVELENFSDSGFYLGIQISLHVNLLRRFTRSKFTEANSPEELNELKEAFIRHHDAVSEIFNTDKVRFAIPMAVTAMRNAIFFAEIELVSDEGVEWDNSIESLELLRAIQDEVEEYGYLAKESLGKPIAIKRHRISLE